MMKEIDEEKMAQLGQDMLDITITQEWNNADLRCYEETTADGYEVFVISADDNVSVCENVFYYDHELADEVMDELNNGDTLYIEEDFAEEIDLNEKFIEYFVENVDEFIADPSSSVSKEEVEWLKDTYQKDDEENDEETVS